MFNMQPLKMHPSLHRTTPMCKAAPSEGEKEQIPLHFPPAAGTKAALGALRDPADLGSEVCGWWEPSGDASKKSFSGLLSTEPCLANLQFPPFCTGPKTCSACESLLYRAERDGASQGPVLVFLTCPAPSRQQMSNETRSAPSHGEESCNVEKVPCREKSHRPPWTSRRDTGMCFCRCVLIIGRISSITAADNERNQAQKRPQPSNTSAAELEHIWTAQVAGSEILGQHFQMPWLWPVPTSL